MINVKIKHRNNIVYAKQLFISSLMFKSFIKDFCSVYNYKVVKTRISKGDMISIMVKL